MQVYSRAAAPVCAAICLLALQPGAALAQPAPDVLSEQVITADRTPADLARVGSAISVIEAKDIANWGGRHAGDLLRHVPGVDVTETGGPAGLSYATIRGSSDGQTLVLIDGIRTGDAAGTNGATDLSNIATSDVERIEVLRGPQTALYGSDAMGGVINIITRKGSREPRSSLMIEGGSYGSLAMAISNSGSKGNTTWALSLSGLHTDGFSAYGHRIGRIESQFTRKLESDSSNRLAGSARVTQRLGENFEIDLGFRRVHLNQRLDNPGAFLVPDRDTAFNKGRQTFTQIYGKLSGETFGGALRNSMTIYANWLDRTSRIQQGCFDVATFATPDCDFLFRSRRAGIEYQGELNLGAAGTTVAGAKYEQEEAVSRENWLSPPVQTVPGISGRLETRSAFLLHRLSLGQLHLSLGGRVDAVGKHNVFPTWRATAAYVFQETATKLRASAGTGAKAPTLYQLISIYGTPSLRPERNFGFDAGIEQEFLDGRIKLSATYFDARYRDLFDFNPAGNGGIGAYVNVRRARTAGVETSAEAIIVPDAWRLRASYTRLHAEDLVTRQALLRRSRDKGSVSLIYTGAPGLEVEGRATYVGRRVDFDNDTFGRAFMPAFAKLDVRASYKATENVRIFGRVENLTNARYQVVRDYGTAGRSAYAGIEVSW